MAEVIEEASASLERLQTFKVSSLPRKDDLGRELNFEAAVEPATRIINFFKLIPISVLSEYPDNELQKIRTEADAVFKHLKDCLDFSISGQSEGNVQSKRNTLITNIANSYQHAFSKLYPLISYASSRAVDFGRLEAQGKAVVQAIEDRSEMLSARLEEQGKEATLIVGKAREAAAKQGVAQQAIYFKEEAASHDTAAERWRIVTIAIASLLALVAIISVVLYSKGIPATPELGDSIQLVFAKVLIFGAIAYLLALSARNFLSHKHNAIVNRHRQNALMTFEALAKASTSNEAQDIILSHAAGCIFAPQPTGYTKTGTATSSGASMAETLPRVLFSRPPFGTDAG